MNAPDPVQHMMQLVNGYQVSSALFAVAEAGVADHLADGPRSTADLAARTGTNEDALFRILRLLAMVGVFEECGPRTFRLTPAADLMRRDHPHSMHAMLMFLPDPAHFRIFACLGESLRTGRPAAEAALGMPIFEFFRSSPRDAAAFNHAMTAISAASIPAVLAAYDFSDIGTLVDVAGGHGEVLIGILRRYPSMRGVLVDLEDVAAGARERIAAAGLADRAQAVAGDFFESLPSGADAYLMQHIIHDWDDEPASRILRNVHRAMGSRESRLLVLEGIVAPGNQPDPLKGLDLEMLALPGGRERTEEEYRRLFAGAGFELESITPTRGLVSVIEGRRQAG
jgi:hypothetical protein